VRPVRESAVEYSLVGPDKRLFIIQPHSLSKAGRPARRLKVRKRERAQKKALSPVIVVLLMVIMTATASTTSSTTTSTKTTGTSSIFTKTTSTSQMTSTSPVQAGYTIFIDSDGKIKARNAVTGIIDYQSAAAAAVLQRAIDALSSTGGLITLRSGTYVWESVPALPKDLPHWLKIVGETGVTIRLTGNGPRAFDFSKTADYDTFQHIWLEGFTVDCNNVGGRHHVVLGSYIDGFPQTRINIQHIVVRNISTVNVPVDSSPSLYTYRWNIGLWVFHPVPGERQTNIQDILIEDCDFRGGNYGVGVLGGGFYATGLNVFVDNVRIYRCRHTLLSVPVNTFISANVHVVGRGFGGYVHVADCVGFYSGDVGIEVNAATDALVENCTVEDAANCAFYHGNYNYPKELALQTIAFRNCKARKISLGSSLLGHGFRVTTATMGDGTFDKLNVPIGNVTIDGCSYFTSKPSTVRVEGEAISIVPNSGLKAAIVRNFSAEITGVDYRATGVLSNMVIYVEACGGDQKTDVRIQSCDISVKGARQAETGELNYCGIFLSGCRFFTIEDVRVLMSVTNMADYTQKAIDIGCDTSILDGTIRGLAITSITSDKRATGITIRGTKSLTITEQIRIEYCDFSGLPLSGSEVSFRDPTNAAKTYLAANKGILSAMAEVKPSNNTVLSWRNPGGYEKLVMSIETDRRIATETKALHD